MKKYYFILLMFFFIPFYFYPEKINLAVFPFYPDQIDFPQKYLFFKDMIADLIKQEINQNGFIYLIPDQLIETTVRNLILGNNYYTDEKIILKIAEKIKADYICKGNFTYKNNRIYVHYQVMAVKEQRIIHQETGIYRIDENIFKTIEETTRFFTGWLNEHLPLYMEPTAVSPKYTIVNLNLKRYVQLNTSFIYCFYLNTYHYSYNNNPGVLFSIKWHIPGATFLSIGTTILFAILDFSKNYQKNQNVTIYTIPIIFTCGISLNLLRYIEMEASTGTGFSVNLLSVQLEDPIELTANIRSALYTDLNIAIILAPYLKISLGLLFYTSFSVIENFHIITIAPALTFTIII